MSKMYRLFVLWMFGSVVLLPSLKASETPKLISRSEQRLEDTWDLDALYPGLKAWEEAIQKELATDFEATVAPYKSVQKLSAQQIRELLDLYEERERAVDKLTTWGYLHKLQDLTSEDGEQGCQRIFRREYLLSTTMEWLKEKILHYEISEIGGLIEAPELAPYAMFLKRLHRLKSHTLPLEQESLLNWAEQVTKTAQKAFSSLTDADFVFEDVEDGQGNTHPLSHALYYRYTHHSPDPVLRKNAFETYHKVYKQHENTLACLLKGQIQRHLFNARTHNYQTCLEAALYPNNIPTSVYYNLIRTVRDHVDVLHRYVRLIKQYHHLDKVHLYDLGLFREEDGALYPYDEAVFLTLEACRPLGPSYVKHLQHGLTVGRWVDKYENAHKCSGASSKGCYDSAPYILLNYAGGLNDVYMLAHEAGHSMHSELSKTQSFHYSNFPTSQYPLFIAEVASTFHEHLLSQYLLQKSPSDLNLQLNIVEGKIHNMVLYLFVQSLFAEFELFLHETVEQNRPLTPKILRDKYAELYAFYFGSDLVVDDTVSIGWATIPHFYNNFYVYQYATGYSASLALAEKVLAGGEKERDAYLAFLKAGRSQDSIDLLRSAGVDVTSPEPVDHAIQHFDHLLDLLESLLSKTQGGLS